MQVLAIVSRYVSGSVLLWFEALKRPPNLYPLIIVACFLSFLNIVVMLFWSAEDCRKNKHNYLQEYKTHVTFMD